jgi:hypothetical protein
MPLIDAQHRPIFFVDANTIWHRRIAEALSAICDTTAFTPKQGLLPKKSCVGTGEDGLKIVSSNLVPGWASRTAAVGQRQLEAEIHRAAAKYDVAPIVVLTSPKYGLLARQLERRYPLVYYCADDYREYVGWGGMKMAEAEAKIIGRCALSVFVSEALRQRAIAEYDVHYGATFVSPNATEQRFLAHSSDGCTDTARPFACAARPVVGLLGGLNQRLNLNLIKAVADLPNVGTLAVVGPVDDATRRTAPDLCSHAKVVITGRLPHTQMHIYAHAIDAALIPYAASRINHFCSPMRLYDHLATGVPIYASDTCEQINTYGGAQIKLAKPEDLPQLISDDLLGGTLARLQGNWHQDLQWSARAERLSLRLGAL